MHETNWPSYATQWERKVERKDKRCTFHLTGPTNRGGGFISRVRDVKAVSAMPDWAGCTPAVQCRREVWRCSTAYHIVRQMGFAVGPRRFSMAGAEWQRVTCFDEADIGLCHGPRAT